LVRSLVPRESGLTPARRSSCSVRARAFGAGHPRDGLEVGQLVGLQRIEDRLRGDLPRPPRPRRGVSARKAAAARGQLVRLNLVMPKVAPASRATARDRPRATKPTMISSVAGESAESRGPRQACRRGRRGDDAHTLLLRTPCRRLGNAAHAASKKDILHRRAGSHLAFSAPARHAHVTPGASTAPRTASSSAF
jgi:hypothetical protein